MRVLTVVNTINSQAQDAAMLLSAYFMSQGIENHIIGSEDVPTPEELALDHEAVLEVAGIKPFFMAIALGGDGTILRAARIAQLFDAPILGINFGHMGFLANPAEPGVVPIIAAALAGDVTEDRRTNLVIEVVCQGDDELPDDEKGPRRFFALNEATVTRGSCPRNLKGIVEVSGDEVWTLHGDGLIVATATGSTAYALSAGGPLVSPGLAGMVLVPLASHTLQSRAIVTESHDVIEAVFDLDDGFDFAELQVDGTTVSFPSPIERVLVRCGETPTKLLFYKKESFYQRIARTFFLKR